jgi:hypothetical protein
MEGGVDNMDEDTSRVAALDQPSEAQADAANENKFQKAIGAWRRRICVAHAQGQN